MALPLFVLAWLLTVPAVLTLSTLVAVAGRLVGVAWVANMACASGQATDGVAGVLHETEQAHPRQDEGTRR